jgi:hypothetical protein
MKMLITVEDEPVIEEIVRPGQTKAVTHDRLIKLNVQCSGEEPHDDPCQGSYLIDIER